MLKTRFLGKYLYHPKSLRSDSAAIKVYDGCQQKTGRPVSIKIVSKDKTACFAERQLPLKVINQMQILSYPQNINIIKLIQISQNDFYLYIVTERGESKLSDHIRHLRPVIKSFQIFTDILLCVLQLKSKGFLHQLITPNHLQITKRRIKISGLDNCVKESQRHFSNFYLLQQNWKWLPPETLNRRIFSQKTLVWNLGVLLTLLLFGKQYFHFPTKDDLLENLFSGGIQFPKIHPFLDKLLSKCLEVNQKDRPNLSDLLELLNESQVDLQFQELVREKFKKLQVYRFQSYTSYLVKKQEETKQIEKQIEFIYFLERASSMFRKAQFKANTPPIINLTRFLIRLRAQRILNSVYWKTVKVKQQIRQEVEQISEIVNNFDEEEFFNQMQGPQYQQFKIGKYKFIDMQITLMSYQRYLRIFIKQILYYLLNTKNENEIFEKQEYTVYSLDFALSIFEMGKIELNKVSMQRISLQKSVLKELSSNPMSLEVSQVYRECLRRARMLGFSHIPKVF